MSTSPLHAGVAIWRGITHRVWPKILSPKLEMTSSDVFSREQETIVGAEISKDNLLCSEQIVKLVRLIFLSGPTARRHVLFSSVGEDTDISDACHRVALTLAAQSNTDVCWIDATSDSANASLQQSSDDKINFKQAASLISENVWRIPGAILSASGAGNAGNRSVVMESLKREFPYGIVQSSAPIDCDTAVLGQFCDGAVLVLRANVTRRMAARRAKEILESADVRILGTILCDREFPIPELLYRMF